MIVKYLIAVFSFCRQYLWLLNFIASSCMNGINFCMYIYFFINAVFQVTVHLYDFKLDQTVKKNVFMLIHFI